MLDGESAVLDAARTVTRILRESRIRGAVVGGEPGSVNPVQLPRLSRFHAVATSVVVSEIGSPGLPPAAAVPRSASASRCSAS